MRKRFLTILILVFEISSFAKDGADLNLLPSMPTKIGDWSTDLNVRNGVMAGQNLPKIDELNQLLRIISWPVAIMALRLQKKERISIEENKSSMDLLFEDSRLKKEKSLRESIIKFMK